MENPLGLSWKAEWGLKMQGSQPKTPSSQRHYFHARFFFKSLNYSKKSCLKNNKMLKMEAVLLACYISGCK